VDIPAPGALGRHRERRLFLILQDELSSALGRHVFSLRRHDFSAFAGFYDGDNQTGCAALAAARPVEFSAFGSGETGNDRVPREIFQR
jgi:hypothetical protein